MRTSVNAASLAAGVGRVRTGTIAFAVPDLEEPYFAELTALMVRRAESRGLSVVIQQTAGVHEREVAVANGVGAPVTDGLILIPRALTVADLTRRQTPGPLVLVGEHIEASPFAHVTVDNRAAMRAATEHLLAHGCRRLALVGPAATDAASVALNRRAAGFHDALSRRGMAIADTALGTVTEFTPAEGRRATQELLASGAVFDGVVAVNDSVAFGVMSALWDAGRRVPEEVAVIGMDDVVAARYSTPSLSTIAPDKVELVERALDMLERQIGAHPAADQPVAQVTVGFQVVERASTRR